MNEKIVKGFKFVLKNAAGIGITLLCSAFAGSVAGSNNSGFFKKTLMALGGAVIGGMIVQQADKYIDSEIDRGIELTNQILNTANKMSAATEETK